MAKVGFILYDKKRNSSGNKNKVNRDPSVTTSKFQFTYLCVYVFHLFPVHTYLHQINNLLKVISYPL